eukprot:1548371-Rhodomonas_salina.1
MHVEPSSGKPLCGAGRIPGQEWLETAGIVSTVKWGAQPMGAADSMDLDWRTCYVWLMLLEMTVGCCDLDGGSSLDEMGAETTSRVALACTACRNELIDRRTLACRSSILEHLEHCFRGERHSGAFGALLSRKNTCTACSKEPSDAGLQEQHSGAFGALFTRKNTCTACRHEPITAGVREQHSGAFGALFTRKNVCTACRKLPIAAGVREQHSGAFKFGAWFSRKNMCTACSKEPSDAGLQEQHSGAFGALFTRKNACTACRHHDDEPSDTGASPLCWPPSLGLPMSCPGLCNSADGLGKA